MPVKRRTDRQPHSMPAGEGPSFWVLDLPGQAKATGEQTGGSYSLVEAVCPPGYATPLHIHYLEDESLYVLQGEVSVVTGGRTLMAGPGSYAYQPRGIAHGFRVTGRTPARLLCLTVPAGADHGLPPDVPPLSPLGPATLELETLADLAAHHHIDVLGPLPETAAPLSRNATIRRTE